MRSPEKLFTQNKGYCTDAANFAISTLNKIDPAYNARWVFIKNAKCRPHHWVTAFDYNGKLYIMDYGAGDGWGAMKGVHDPYDSLSEYGIFLATLNISNFRAGEVRFRDMPGKED